MSTATAAALLGGVGGVASMLVILAVLRRAPVNVAAAVAELDNQTACRADGVSLTVERASRLERLAGYAARSTNRWWGIPTRDLDVLDCTPERYVARRLAWAAAAAGGVLVLAALAWVGGLGLPATVIGPAVVLAAVAGSAVPVLSVREDAVRARDEFRRATAAYLDLVAQERATGRAPSQALSEAAAVGDSWAFARISRALGRALRAGHTPWDALSRLGRRMGVVELADLADILASAADGAAIYTTLLAKSSALRSAALAADRADANARSHRLALPVTVLLLAFLVLVMYPAMIRLLEGGLAP